MFKERYAKDYSVIINLLSIVFKEDRPMVGLFVYFVNIPHIFNCR
jgi:hypothetical protein